MYFGSSDKEEHWWTYLNGKGWTAHPRSQYMSSPDYNKDLRRTQRSQHKGRSQLRRKYW